MEADWTVEIGGEAESIEVDWPGFVDLLRNPEAVDAIAEAPPGSPLRRTLMILNGPRSLFYTSKCDQWTLPAEELDPFEHDFPSGESWVGLAAYVDLIARNTATFASFERNEEWARRTVQALRAEPITNGRVELVIRAARERRADGFGITLYVIGCGPDAPSARAAWEAVMRTVVNVTMGQTREPVGE